MTVDELSEPINYWLQREKGERIVGPVYGQNISFDVESPTVKGPPYEVLLTYFKTYNGTNDTGGKYYSEGKYETRLRFTFDIIDEVLGLRDAGTLPGLVEGSKEWHILIDVPEHPTNVPYLLPWR